MVSYMCPAHWDETLDLPGFFVTIDADIEVPESGAFPIYRVRAAQFLERTEALKTILNSLIPNANGVRAGGMTWEDCQKAIERLQLGLYDVDLNTFVPYLPDQQAEVDAEIRELLKQQETATGEDDFMPLTGGLSYEAPSDYVYRTADATIWSVGIDENILTISKPGASSYPESWFINERPAPGMPQPTPYQNIRITEEEARSAVQDFFASIGDDSWDIINVERAGMLKKYYNVITDYQHETQGWQVDCLRGGANAIQLDYRNSGGARIHFDEAPYAATLPLESMQLFVDENGIYSLRWENPLTVTDTVVQNIALLPFEEIQVIFLQTLRNGLAWAEDRPASDPVNLNPTRKGIVEKAALSYSYVQEKNNPGFFLMTPTWFFWYTTEQAKDATKNGAAILPMIIAINAVDGSRITLTEGY